MNVFFTERAKLNDTFTVAPRGVKEKSTLCWHSTQVDFSGKKLDLFLTYVDFRTCYCLTFL